MIRYCTVLVIVQQSRSAAVECLAFGVQLPRMHEVPLSYLMQSSCSPCAQALSIVKVVKVVRQASKRFIEKNMSCNKIFPLHTHPYKIETQQK